MSFTRQMQSGQNEKAHPEISEVHWPFQVCQESCEGAWIIQKEEIPEKI